MRTSRPFLLLAVVLGLLLVGVTPAGASDPTARGAALAPAGGRDYVDGPAVTFPEGDSYYVRVHRDGWSVRVAPGGGYFYFDHQFCIEVEAEIVVRGGFDPNSDSARTCHSPGEQTYTPPQVKVRGPGSLGIEFERVDVTLTVTAQGQPRTKVTQKITAPQDAPDNVDLAPEAKRLYGLPMKGFQAAKAKGQPARLNWTDDGCSLPFSIPGVSKKYEEKFRDACERHDFGYRNFGGSNQNHNYLDPTDARRERIDTTFLADMRATCDGATCRGVAQAFYQAVRRGAGLVFYKFRTPGA